MQLLLARPLLTLEVDPAADAAGLAREVGRQSGLPMEHLYVQHAGRVLGARPGTLRELGVRPGDTVRVSTRLRGGGGDGGCYPPTNAELKWMNDIGGGTKRTSWAVLGGSVSKTQFEKVSTWLQKFDMCSTCALTGEPLVAPVVACDLGMLFNKTALIEALLAKASRPLDPRFAHLRSLKDVTAVTLHADPEYKRESASAAAADAGEEGVLGKAPFHCPVSKLPFNGRHAFYAIRPSGHVVSERALAMTSWKLCPVTETPLQPAPPAPLAGPAGPSEAFPKKRVSADLLLLALDGDELESARRALDDKRAAEPAKPLKAKKRISDKSAAGGSGAGVAPAITDSTATTNAIAKRPRALGIASTAGPSMTLDVSRTVIFFFLSFFSFLYVTLCLGMFFFLTTTSF